MANDCRQIMRIAAKADDLKNSATIQFESDGTKISNSPCKKKLDEEGKTCPLN
jgi:hypothetical protein